MQWDSTYNEMGKLIQKINTLTFNDTISEYVYLCEHISKAW